MKAIMFGGALSLVLSLALTPMVARFFLRKGLGQPIHDDMPMHQVKQGTPTMGGSAVIAAAAVGYLAAHLVAGSGPSASGVLVLLLLVGLGVVGFLDDYLKITRERNLGLRGRTKLIGQTLVAVVFAVLAVRLPDADGLTPASTFVSFMRDLPGLQLGAVVFVLWALFMVSATSNGVNLIDGMDGLSAGTCTLVFAGYTVIGVWQFKQSCSAGVLPGCYQVRDPYDLAILAFSLAAACAGFLWWNANPARIFIGDTGALGLGGAIAGLAITTRTELLLVVIGGLYVAANASVILQRGYFKLTRRLTGTPRRIFLNSPIQFHFALKGWPEITIVIRFWIIGGILVATGVGMFYAEWLTHS
ncbi:phospho-N-acetylmuramoyl-pentapeptide-transferase [Actinopolymorpha cephalotaxi]|uniref:Phospho-N-acetylmuramoyl-pentapeptide-transferase n=1 Tax=Actinopolymorpha cephalotaxi TaxID=504797 RepID=A0A1I2WXB6_9ACTN|nr:phospho-N-acetylmuramoyl-pentapeptide-transferase [Actinopolymorpha cephalotaxi]NYH85185.1 phospho-N-acetylmuramoyl-pentapeptide-transferase [Actinopolymorpha cephalotaxi]SFH05984.1 phospho-N-acetylmuramoyl-pentapeptide-transferase [Actinopolymorpha cephalotaxi]